MVDRTNLTLQAVADWGDANLVRFNTSKTQACLFTAKKSPFNLAPTFRNVPVPVSKGLNLLGVDLSSLASVATLRSGLRLLQKTGHPL